MIKKKCRFFIIFLVTAGILSSIYLITSKKEYSLGFPLDDAWIHQTFARNLVQYGNWSFNPGEPAAGSTAPLWTILISLGYYLKINPFFWTYLLGVIGLTIVGFISFLYLQLFLPDYRLSVIISILIMGEWHLVWAAVSGMEILFLTVLAMAVFLYANQQTPRGWVIGILIGISIWARPDGITLLGPVLWIWIWNHRNQKPVSSLIKILVPVFVLSAIYLFFNYQISGSILPNTFYAKQREYAEVLSQPYLIRLGNMTRTILAGPGILWMGGFLIGIVFSIKEKKYYALAPYLWVLGYVMLYAARLPVYYQHGRYLMPILGVMLISSVHPLFILAEKIKAGNMRFIASRVFAVTICLVTILFLFIGAQAYAKDTAIIENEMVKTARWIADHTSEDAMIAAHDIGALGYYGNRKILDLAGLVTPEVIPFIRDSQKLSSFILEKDADYLIVFPDWYIPPLTVPGKLVYQTKGKEYFDQVDQHLEIYKIQ